MPCHTLDSWFLASAPPAPSAAPSRGLALRLVMNRDKNIPNS